MEPHHPHLELAAQVDSLRYWFQVRLARSEEHGATAVEYALMVGLISVAILVSVAIFSSRLRTAFGTYSNTIPN